MLADSYIKSIEDDESGQMNLRLRQRTRQFLRGIARNDETGTNDITLIVDYLSGDLGST